MPKDRVQRLEWNRKTNHMCPLAAVNRARSLGELLGFNRTKAQERFIDNRSSKQCFVTWKTELCIGDCHTEFPTTKKVEQH
jgi:hypothetical protein